MKITLIHQSIKDDINDTRQNKNNKSLDKESRNTRISIYPL